MANDELQSLDLGYDPNFVPDSVKTFVVHLYRHIREKNVYEIHQMYESSFQSLSERLFKDTPWPSVDAVAQYVDNNHVFCLLYREMWFRHLYARLTPTVRQRIDSWDNYCNLFQVVLHGVVNMQLPNQWLWDMVDEFVYQFQSFCQYRAKMKNKNEQEIALLRQFDQAWNVFGVLNFLQALVEKSTIIQILEQEKLGLEQFTANDGYDYNGGSNVLKVLGYFGMVGLLRVHCLLGDYHTGLKCLQPIDISQPGLYTIVIGCHITTIYHYGFANLMLRRYVEAIREFNKILLYIFKTKVYHQKSPQYEQILKKNEQMYALLAISLSLCPQSRLVDETVNSQLREKYGEKMIRMQRYDDEAFAMYDELFSYACPKFITPSAPNFDEPLVNYNQDAYRLQLKLFLYEAKQQQLLSGLRTFLKVYSTISLGKLASYMEVDEPTLRTILMTYKHKTHVVDTAGKVISNADVGHFARGVGPVSLLGGQYDGGRKIGDLKLLYRAYVTDALAGGRIEEYKLAALTQLRNIFGMGKREAEEITIDVTSKVYRKHLSKAFSGGELEKADSKAAFLQNLCDELHFDPQKACKIHEEIYRQKLQRLMADGELSEDDAAALLRLRVMLCIPQDTVETAHSDICGSLFGKVVMEAIASGVDGYDAEIKKSVRKTAHGLQLTREIAMSIASNGGMKKRQEIEFSVTKALFLARLFSRIQAMNQAIFTSCSKNK